MQRNLKICILQQFDQMNNIRQDLYVTLLFGVGKHTHRYLIGRPAEMRSLKDIDADAKELLEWFLHEDSIGVD